MDFVPGESCGEGIQNMNVFRARANCHYFCSMCTNEPPFSFATPKLLSPNAEIHMLHHARPLPSVSVRLLQVRTGRG